MGQDLGLIVSSSGTSCMRGVCILVLLHKDNKLRSIYRKLKRQDDLCGHECPNCFCSWRFCCN